ncbi:pseudouridine synthase [Chondromyces apiculatus]|uniref:tRNA pseudouridine synthase C n=1 Tax=Chondromyces apiculatus DSM 436 TaxID=1192034 RepID=A0A017T332_9BACT|nr:pseudouridine synthase [Chondromyces apiculatus]EYF03407.1 tRNA pseudouridine synthase C [Chondromyces apiculatus DSM 436]
MSDLAGELTILLRNERYVVVDKPSGLSVHRGDARDPVTALDVVRDRVGRWVYAVHRLDRGTSGALIFALAPEHVAPLQALFSSEAQGDGSEARVVGRGMEKQYLALVRGFAPEEGVIDHPVPKSEGGPRVPAITAFRRLATAEGCSLVEARPRTGRFHQIRRHLKHINHPLLGDANYGKGALNRRYREEVGLARLALHAAALSFVDPWTGEPVRVVAKIPEDLALPLGRLGIALPDLGVGG